MEQFFNWLINAPVWIQSTLLLIVLMPLCAGLAVLVMRIAARLVPPSDNERQLLLTPEGDDVAVEPSAAAHREERN